MTQTKFIILFLPMLLSGCSTLEPKQADIPIPIPIIDSPEVGGQPYRAIIGVRTQSMYNLNLAKDTELRPPDLSTDFPVTGNVTIAPYGGLQLHEKMSLTGGLSPFGIVHSGLFTKFQIQLLGEPAVRAQIGNFSLSTTVELHSLSRSGRVTTAQAQSILGAVSMGYRFHSNALVFWGLGAGTGKAEGQIYQAATTTLPAAEYSLSPQSFTTYSTAVGLDVTTWRHHFMPKLEVSWLLNNNQTALTYRALIEWRFDLFRSEENPKSLPQNGPKT